MFDVRKDLQPGVISKGFISATFIRDVFRTCGHDRKIRTDSKEER